MNAPQPLPADRGTLAKILERKPVLWVGAGLSIAAGYPSTWKLVEAMAQAADDPIDTSRPYFAVADAFIASVGKGQLGELLQKLLKSCAGPRRRIAPSPSLPGQAASTPSSPPTNYLLLQYKALVWNRSGEPTLVSSA